jgi:hypothetical protein
MDARKIIGVLLGGALAMSLCFGQELIEAAKKEKERRETQKGKKIVSITNADLAALKKKPSLPGSKPESQTVDAAAEAEANSVNTAETPLAKPVPKPADQPPPKTGAEPASEPPIVFEEQKAGLQTAYDRAKERVELLNLKMLSLRQQLTTFNSMESKERVQKDVADTYQRLLQAQAEAIKAKDELEKFINQGAKDKASTIWIK